MAVFTHFEVNPSKTVNDGRISRIFGNGLLEQSRRFLEAISIVRKRIAERIQRIGISRIEVQYLSVIGFGQIKKACALSKIGSREEQAGRGWEGTDTPAEHRLSLN